MDFRNMSPKSILIPALLGILVFAVILWKAVSLKSNPEEPTSEALAEPAVQNMPTQPELAKESDLDTSTPEDAAIQKQLDRDREEQKQTKYLKTKLEQTDLELEEEKSLAEINKLKMANMGAFKEPSADGQKNFPEVIVDYIGGDSIKKEAILSIAGASYQVKDKSSPTDNIQVVSISDSSVTLHFSAPQELTKTIDYKPE